MKRSGMIRRIIITLMIITFLSGNLEGLAEGILPSLKQDTRTATPSIGEALQRDPDSETENADGSVTERYTNISNADYETFSVYLQEQGAVLANYKLEDNVLTAEIRANDASFFLNYDIGSGEAMVTYPAGAYGKKAQKTETQPVAEEQKGNSALIMKVGDNVTFGRYEQDNDLTNGPEEIEWIVLDYDKNNYKALLISKYGLDVHVYHEYGEVTWETCDLRKWLNNSFLNEAFSREEQNAILMTEVDNSSSQGYSGWKPVGGNNTQDQVFLLSCAEADLYFGVGTPDDENLNRRMAPTPYALARGAFTDGVRLTAENIPAGHWWLRSPGAKPTEAAEIIEFGDCQSKPVMVEECIRPAIWVNSESIEGLTEEIETNNNQETADEEKTPVQEDKQEDTAEETAEENPDDAKNKDAMASYKRAGSIITFGTYEQDNNLENGLEPIEWIVLTYDEANHRSMLISKYGLDTITFAEWSTKHDCTWEDSIARKWLNQYFIYSAFSPEERKVITVTEVDDNESQDRLRHGKRELPKTQDQIFLLSKREAEIYLRVDNQDAQAQVAPTPYAIAQGAFVSNKFKTAEGLLAGTWLLRTYLYDCQGMYVNQIGTTDTYELESNHGGGDSHVARPALWLDLNVLEGLLSSAEERKDDNPKEVERETKVLEYSRAGSIVTFGTYEQDNNLENGPEPIEWIVLTYDEANHRSMLISKYGLDTITFAEWSTKHDCTWEDSIARKWLNQYFLYSAFSQEERKAIPVTEVDDMESQERLRHEKRELQNTQDRIFLLSKGEAGIYLGVTGMSPYDNKDVRARVAPTPYAIARGAFISNEFRTAEDLPAGTWLLRTYLYDCMGMYVNESGTNNSSELLQKRGEGEPHVGRPVFWLDLDAAEVLLNFEDDQNHDDNSAEAERRAKIAQYSRPGNIVTFGHYEQDNDPANGPEPIEWIVLTADDTTHRAMLVSKYGLDVLEYHNVHRFKQQITWETCSAREWLNDTFLNTAFSEEEQKAIPIMELDNSDRANPLIKLKGELNNTQDRIFLLSKTEAGIYFNLSMRDEQTGSRIAPTFYAIAQGAFISDTYQTAEGLPAGRWPLRTPCDDYSDGMVVNQSGNYYDYEIDHKHRNGGNGSLTVARPALWLDLNADIF